VSEQLFWYTARAAGITAWALLSASVLWGLALSTRALGRRPRRPWLLDLHRYLGGLAVVFTGVHIASIVADSYVHFGLTDVLVPLASSWKPVPVALGIVGLYLLLAVELSSLVRDRLPRTVWHTTHLLSIPLFVLTTLHLLLAGSDAGNTLLRWSALIVNAAVVGLIAVRVDALKRRPVRSGTHDVCATPTAPKAAAGSLSG
jgi:predicted ferric reductase